MKEKRTQKGGCLILLLLAVDLALLVWIGKSCTAQKKEDAQFVQEFLPTASTPSEKEAAQKPEPQSEETPDRPTDEDFLEWYTKDVMWNGVPAGVERITDFSQITGAWKGLIYHDPHNERDSEGVELLNFTVSGTEDAASLTADWYSIYFVAEGKEYSQEEEDDSVFTGSWRDGALEVTGAGSIHLTEFYVKDGRQYAAGTMDCVDGVYACVAMVRP